LATVIGTGPMPRRPLDVGTYGNIKVTVVASGRVRATARYRDKDGQTRQVQAFGGSGADAERNLKANLKVRQQQSCEDITPDMKLEVLADLWLDELTVEGEVSAQTIACYRAQVTPSTDKRRKHTTVTIKTGIGGLRVREATTSRINAFLKSVAKDHPTKARHMKVVLTGMLGMAVRHDALAVNPVREVSKTKRSAKDVRALSTGELKALRERVRLWEEDTEHAGRRRARGMLDVVDVMLATGARVGEVLAIRWADIDLGAQPPRLTICGTVIRAPVTGLRRQEHTKTSAGHRTVLLPRFAVDTLMRLQLEAKPNPYDVIFPSSVGTLRDPHNLRRQWRDARGAMFAWVTPHSFRKTVATLVDREHGSDDAATQLGHSGTAVTKRHYIEKAIEAPDLTDVLEQLGG
jgi:integrase